MLQYDFPLWRPPSEGDNLIIQATLGCRYNRCSFCSMYKEKGYRARPLDAVLADIDLAAGQWPEVRRVFLADGDAYTLPTEALLAIADRLKQRFLALQRISTYATPFNILAKSPEEIAALKTARLGLVYLGVESGSDRMLKAINKGSAKQMEAALTRARQTALKVSATVILGLGGQSRWQEHIEATAAMISRQPPAYLSTLQLVLDPAVAPGFFDRFGESFHWQDDRALLQELRLLIERLAPASPIIFRSNHASNALALAGTLPKDRDKLLAEIDLCLDGRTALRPRWLRGL